MRLRRPVVLAPLVVLTALSGCGLLGDAAPGALAEGSPPPIAPVPRPTVPPPTVPPPTVPPPPGPVEVAAASLADRSGAVSFSGSVRAVRTPVRIGPPPLPAPFAQDCALPDDGSVRSLAVEVTFTDTSTAAMSGLAADVTLTAADGGPPRAGTAVVVGSSSPGTRWCQDGTTSPVTDGFAVGSGVGSVTTVAVWVVARGAAPTADLVLRISGLRNEAGSNATGPWDEVHVSAGACADDPAALCVPLG